MEILPSQPLTSKLNEFLKRKHEKINEKSIDMLIYAVTTSLYAAFGCGFHSCHVT